MQGDDLGCVLRIDEVQIPGKVTRLDGRRVEGDFQTAVLDITGIDELVGVTGAGRDADRHDLVRGVLLVIGGVDADAVVEEAPVDTDFPGVLALRTEVGRIDGIRDFQTVDTVVAVPVVDQGIRRIDPVGVGVVTDLGPGGTYFQEGHPIREGIAEGIGYDPGSGHGRIEIRVVAMTVGIDQGGRPVVTAGHLEEDLVAPGKGGLSDQGEDGLLTADVRIVTRGILGVADEILAGNNESAVRPHGDVLQEIVVILATDETGEVPVGAEALVEHQVRIQVGLLLGGKAHAIGTAFVHEARTEFLGFAADIVIIVVAFRHPLEPGGQGYRQLEVRTDGSFFLVLVRVVQGEPKVTTGSVTVLVTIAGAGDTAILALVAGSPIAGVVQTAPGTVDEFFTEVRHGATRLGIGEIDAGLQFHPVRNLVGSLGKQGKTVERIVRRRTVRILVRHGRIEGRGLVSALDGHVRVGIPTQVKGLAEVVLLRQPLDDAVIIVTDVAAVELRTVRGAILIARRIINGRNAIYFVQVVPVPHRVRVVAEQREITLAIFVLETRTAIDVVDTDGLGEADAQATGTAAALGGDNHRAIQTTGTIQGGSSRTLQDGHGLEIVRVEVLQFITPVLVGLGPVGITVLVGIVQDHAVDDIDRLVVAGEGGSTTDDDLAGTEHTTVRSGDLDTGDLALEGGNRVDDVVGKLVALHFRNGITQGFLVPADTESGHDRSFQHFAVFGENDIQVTAVPGQDLGGVTDTGELDLVPYLYIGKGVRTVDIHDGAVVGSLDKHRCSDNTLSGSVFHGSPDRRLRKGRQARCQQREGQGHFQK